MTDLPDDPRAEFIEQVLQVVESIPAGRVMTYGSIAKALGRGGPRGVGGVMATDGYAVPWWRVVRANGTLPGHLVVEAQQHWYAEGTPLHRGTVDIKLALWEPEQA